MISSHCLANYLRKAATAHVPTHVARQYQTVIGVIAVKTGFPATPDSTLRQRDRANCALYQFDRSVTNQKLMMRDLEKNGDLYHYNLLSES